MQNHNDLKRIVPKKKIETKKGERGKKNICETVKENKLRENIKSDRDWNIYSRRERGLFQFQKELQTKKVKKKTRKLK